MAGAGGGSGEGVAAVGGLLEAIAARTPRTGAGPVPPAERGGCRRRRAAGAAVDEAVWLELMRSSVEHSLALTNTDLVTERAATHPGRPDALLDTAVRTRAPPGEGSRNAGTPRPRHRAGPAQARGR
ncbi:hypothetical protein ACIQVO_35935, partial [Streptomyces sp. NPDC101062]|uniref:hypothetical protein n=1 Tax=Streptomyces sp. NPDC101062 TaxID=3366103 RepID=UPI00381A6B02